MKISIDELVKLNIVDEVLIFPTDTVYGIGASIFSENGVKRIYDLKNRDKTKPLAILCADISQVKKLVLENDELINKCNEFWPGACTFIFEKSNLVSELISNSSTVGIRIPDCEVTKKLLLKIGPVAATSVNMSGSEAMLTLNEVESFTADYIVSDIVKSKDVASTVYDIKNSKVLRSGSVTSEMLRKVFK